MIDHPIPALAAQVAAVVGVNIFANVISWVTATPLYAVLGFVGTLIHAYVIYRRDSRQFKRVEQENHELRMRLDRRVDPEAETKEYVVKKSHKS